MAQNRVERQQSQSGAKGLKLTDILITIVIAVVFGVVYKIWGPLYDAMKPLGLQGEQFFYGMWFIAGTFAFLVIRKPGVAVLAEVAAASVEAMFGGEWGVSTLVYGLLQGLGVEIVFALFAYRNAKAGATVLASLGACVLSLPVDWYYGYIDKLSVWNYCLFIGMRLIGSALIAGLFAYYLTAAVERTGVLSLVRPASKKDYEQLG